MTVTNNNLLKIYKLADCESRDLPNRVLLDRWLLGHSTKQDPRSFLRSEMSRLLGEFLNIFCDIFQWTRVHSVSSCILMVVTSPTSTHTQPMKFSHLVAIQFSIIPSRIRYFPIVFHSHDITEYQSRTSSITSTQMRPMRLWDRLVLVDEKCHHPSVLWQLIFDIVPEMRERKISINNWIVISLTNLYFWIEREISLSISQSHLTLRSSLFACMCIRFFWHFSKMKQYLLY